MNSLRNIKIKNIDFNNEVVHIRVAKNRKVLIHKHSMAST